MSKIEVTSSNGNFYFDADIGIVLDGGYSYDTGSWLEEPKIVMVNLPLYKKMFKDSISPSVDILDIGYICDNGHYEPPLMGHYYGMIQATSERMLVSDDGFSDYAKSQAIMIPAIKVTPILKSEGYNERYFLDTSGRYEIPFTTKDDIL